MTPLVAIIILNWNGWSDTLECLESVYKIKYPHYNVIVVDNNSTDDSLIKIGEFTRKSPNSLKSEKHVPGNLRFYEYNEEDLKHPSKLSLPEFVSNSLILIKNKMNYGFAGGNNIGINFALKSLKADFILLLNNDTIVDPLFLGKLVEPLQSDPNNAVVGPAIFPYTEYPLSKKDSEYSEGNTNLEIPDKSQGIIGAEKLLYKGAIPRDISAKGSIQEVDRVSGCAMLIKAKVLDELGGLDSVYFFGWEDADFCSRAKKNGYKCMGVPDSWVWHKLGSSYNGELYSNPKHVQYDVEGQLIYLDRYANSLQKFTSFFYLPFFYLYLIQLQVRIQPKMIIPLIGGLFRGLNGFINYKQKR